MKCVWRALIVIATLVAAGCQGTDLAPDPKTPTPTDPNAPCTDFSKCCTSTEQQVCTGGDPDHPNRICTCRGLWDCSQNPKKCSQQLPVPPGGSDWNCTWDEFKLTCSGSGTKDNPPNLMPGGSQWDCTWNDKEFKWSCSIPAPNPTNKPEGTTAWKCTVDNTSDKVNCERTDTTAPPQGSGQWSCTTDANGKTICTKQDENGGLPSGNGNWQCNETVINGVKTWICYGTSPTPPTGAGGWTCTAIAGEFNKYKCEKTETSGDIPPGGGWYSCVKGTEFGGTKCEKVPTQPVPPTPTTNDKCTIGTNMWCDGLEYCGWGQVDCDPTTGKWRTKVNEAGQTVLDCRESLAGGKRPNTLCACYHFFFNPACCERPDCIVPPGTSGQICPASPGKLCDYCNPQKSECVQPGAKCIITNSHETFCGQLCSTSAPCPTDYTCMTVKLAANQTTQQCVPSKLSCYY